MSSRLPQTTAREAPENLAILLREPFRTTTERLHRRLAEAGHGGVRPAHGASFSTSTTRARASAPSRSAPR
jgi:hypothetical protein